MRLDGAMGTELMARGLPLGQAPERWVLERPDAVAAVHRAYTAAGAQAAHTCTFGANAARLDAVGLAGRGPEIVRHAVRLAREAGPRWVLGDMGPTGLRLPPGPTPADLRARLRGAHGGLARALLEAGVDALHLETMTDLREARLALEAALEAAVAAGRAVPVWVSLTCRRAPGGGFVTLAGDPAPEALAALRAGGAHAVGVNCLLQAPDMVALAGQVAAAGAGPLVLQPAAGQPRRVPGGDGEPERFVYDGDPARFAQALATAARAAPAVACAVGGCCGTDPGWIARLSRRLDAGA